MKTAKWFFHNWYWFNGAVAVIAAMVLVLTWGKLPAVQWLMLGQLVAINLHFVEEFAMPGGFPLIANTVEKASEVPDRWPLNEWNAAAGNNWFMLFIYLPAFLFPDQTWLTLGVTLFGFLEVLMHAVLFNAILKRPYNPGLWTALLGFLPLGIAYLKVVYSTGNGPVWWMYLVAMIYPAASYLIVFNWLLVTKLARKDTRFPFTHTEMERGSYLVKALPRPESRKLLREYMDKTASISSSTNPRAAK